MEFGGKDAEKQVYLITDVCGDLFCDKKNYHKTNHHKNSDNLFTGCLKSSGILNFHLIIFATM
jgi:hypothetical protein